MRTKQDRDSPPRADLMHSGTGASSCGDFTIVLAAASDSVAGAGAHVQAGREDARRDPPVLLAAACCTSGIKSTADRPCTAAERMTACSAVMRSRYSSDSSPAYTWRG